MSWIGIDVGGTFTDAVAYDAVRGELRSEKAPTTPSKPQQGVLDVFGLGDGRPFLYTDPFWATMNLLGMVGLVVVGAAITATLGAQLRRRPVGPAARLSELLIAGTKSASARSFYESTGSEAWTTTADELAKFQIADAQKWGRVIKAAGIEPE